MKKKKKKNHMLSIPTAVSAECLYMPESITNQDVLNSRKYIDMAEIAVSDYNMKEKTNLKFLEIVKADCDSNVCSGHFYFLSIKTLLHPNDHLFGRDLLLIHKMMWKGSSRSVLSGPVVVSHIPTITTTLVSVSDASTKKLVNLTVDLLGIKESDKLLASSIVVHTEFLCDFPKDAGYLKFIKYHIYFISEAEGQDQEILCSSILHRKWLYTLDDTVAATLRLKVLTPEDLFLDHPLHYPRGKKVAMSKKHSEMCSTSIVKLLEIDLFSPMILSCSWCAIDDYNLNEGAQLKLINVLKVERTNCAGISFHLTLQAKDGLEVVKVFKTGVWIRPWLKSVDITPPLTEVAARTRKHARKLLHDASVRVTRSMVNT